MTGKFFDIRHDDRFFGCVAMPANAFPEINPRASQCSLKRSENELVFFCYVKSNPKKSERFFENCGDVCEIGDQIIFAGNERFDLRRDFVVNNFSVRRFRKCDTFCQII